MNRISCLAAIIPLTLGLATSRLGAEPLDRFSADAAAVIRLKAPEATVGKAADLADAVQPGSGELVRQYAAALGQAIRIPSLAGVDQSRDWYVVLFARGESRPDVFFAVPTTDAAALTSALPEQMTAEVDGDWVIYSDSDAGLPAAVPAGTGIESVLTGESAAVFARGDLSLFVNVAHLTEVYEQEIAMGQEKVGELLQQFGEAAAQVNGMNMEGVIDMYRMMIDGAFQALDDTRGFSIAITVTADRLGVEEYATFTEGSATSETVAAHPGSAMESLARLPAKAVGFFGISGDMRRLMEWGWSMNARLLAGDDEQKQKFAAAQDAWQQVDFGDIVGSFSLGSADDGLIRYYAMAQATPTATLRDNMRKMTELLGKIEISGVTQEMTVTPDAETIGSHAIDLVTVKQQFDPAMDPTGMQAKMQKIMFGPSGMVSRVAYIDGGYVQTMGGGREAMKTLLQSVEGKPNADLARHRSGLIGEPNILVLVDLPNLAVKGLIVASEIPDVPLPIDAEALSGLSLEPSYVGISVAGEPNALRFQTVIPAAQFRGVMTLIGVFQPQPQ